MTVSGVLGGECEEKTLACVVWRSEGKQLRGVYSLLWLKQQPEPSPYKNLPALRPELVLGTTALGMSREVAPRCARAASGHSENREPPPKKRAVYVCVQVGNVLVLERVGWKHAAAKHRLTESRTGAFLILMSGCTGSTISPFPVAFDNLAEPCCISACVRRPGKRPINTF